MRTLSRTHAAVAAVPAVLWMTLVTLRPADSARLAELESARLRSEFVVMSGSPPTHIAERPLWTWGEWHGDEHIAVKALEVATLPALVSAIILTKLIVWPLGILFTVQQESWIRFGLLLALSSLQWALIYAWGKAVLASRFRRAA